MERRKLTMLVTVTAPDTFTAPMVRREIRTLIKHQSFYSSYADSDEFRLVNVKPAPRNLNTARGEIGDVVGSLDHVTFQPSEIDPVPAQLAAPATPNPTVIVTRYEHKRGDTQRVFKTEEAAERWRRDIAREWWAQWMEAPYPSDDPKQAANSYFDRADGYECWSTQSVEVEG